ncbi:hypothetical protein MGH68_01270 [Erysipelothrix sp. D19-032]
MTTMKFYLEDVWGKVKSYIQKNSPLDDMIFKTYIESILVLVHSMMQRQRLLFQLIYKKSFRMIALNT